MASVTWQSVKEVDWSTIMDCSRYKKFIFTVNPIISYFHLYNNLLSLNLIVLKNYPLKYGFATYLKWE